MKNIVNWIVAGVLTAGSLTSCEPKIRNDVDMASATNDAVDKDNFDSISFNEYDSSSKPEGMWGPDLYVHEYNITIQEGDNLSKIAERINRFNTQKAKIKLPITITPVEILNQAEGINRVGNSGYYCLMPGQTLRLEYTWVQHGLHGP